MAKNQRPIFTEDNFDKTCRPVIFHDGAVTKEWASLFGSYKAYYADISNNKEVLLFFESKGAVEGFQVGKDVCDSFVSHFGPKVLAFLQDYGMPDVFDSSSRFNIGDGLEENLDNVEIKSRYPIVGYSNQASIFLQRQPPSHRGFWLIMLCNTFRYAVGSLECARDNSLSYPDAIACLIEFVQIFCRYEIQADLNVASNVAIATAVSNGPKSRMAPWLAAFEPIAVDICSRDPKTTLASLVRDAREWANTLAGRKFHPPATEKALSNGVRRLEARGLKIPNRGGREVKS